MADFGQVEVAVERRTGNTTIASQTYMPDINIGNVASNNFKAPAQQTFEFDIAEQGDYVVAVYSAASEWSDCIVGQLSLTASSYLATGISAPQYTPEDTPSTVYDLQGRRVDSPHKAGVYIKDGKKVLVK